MTGPAIVDLAADALADLAAPRVVVLARRADVPVVERLRGRIADLRIEVLVDLDDPDELHLRLAELGQPDLLVDVAGAPGLRRRFEVAFPHLRVGGVALLRSRPGSPFRTYVEGLARDRAAPPPPDARGRDRDRAALVRSLAALDQHGDVTRAVQATATLAKVPDAVHDRFLAARPGAGRVLLTLDGATWTSRAQVRVTSAPPLNPLPSTLSSPPLSLREHDEVVTLGHAAGHGDGFVLPTSYRRPDNPRPKSLVLPDLAPYVAGRPEPVPDRRLAGAWFLLDAPVPLHFGHAMTEQLGRLWGWEAALERYPDLRGLLHLPAGAVLPAWLGDLLSAAGVPADRVEVVHEPVRVERLVSTSPSYVIGGRLHPVAAETWSRVGAALDAAATTTESHPRIFHTRGHGKRACRNQAEVEALAEDAGFVVLRPEERSLPDQVRLVRRAEVVAGFAGSGLFHTALAARPQRLVVIGSAAYPSHNEYAFAALLGHRLDLVVCRPDVPRGRFFDERTFHSDYAVDLDQEGRLLRRWLAE